MHLVHRAVRGDAHGLGVGRELQRIVDEARDDQRETLVVRQHALRVGCDRDGEAVVVGGFDESRDDLTEHLLEVDCRGLEADLTGLELRDAEQVVGKPGKVFGLETQLVQALVARVLRGDDRRHRA